MFEKHVSAQKKEHYFNAFFITFAACFQNGMRFAAYNQPYEMDP